MKVEPVSDDGLVGVLCSPDNPTGAGVLVLGGSEGGIPAETAKSLAAATGRVVLGLAYFRATGLPRHLVEVPVESVQRGVRWLQKQDPGTDSRVGLVGASKGGELALLAAATYPGLFSAIVAYVPSSVIFEGIGPLGRCGRSSWTRDGAALPFIRYQGIGRLGPRGLRARSMYGGALRRPDQAVVIPVERIACDVLLVSGGDDQLWPSSDMAREVADRIRASGGAVEHLSYPDAGHRLLLPALNQPLPLLAKLADLGGTPSANRAAAQDAWERVVVFLTPSGSEGTYAP